MANSADPDETAHYEHLNWIYTIAKVSVLVCQLTCSRHFEIFCLSYRKHSLTFLAKQCFLGDNSRLTFLILTTYYSCVILFHGEFCEKPSKLCVCSPNPYFRKSRLHFWNSGSALAFGEIKGDWVHLVNFQLFLQARYLLCLPVCFFAIPF